MMYGVTINGEDTRSKWGLILMSDLTIPMPEPRYRFIEVPERDGAIDMSEALTGKLTYSQRKITFTLFAAYDVIRGADKPPNERAFQELKARFSDAYHGKSVSIRFPGDPDAGFQFEGRLTVGEKAGYNKGRIPITIMAEPYRYGGSFDVTLTDQANYTEIENNGLSVYPMITVTSDSDVIIVINDHGHYVSPGVSRSPLPLVGGLNSISIDDQNPATVLFEWRERKF